MKTRRIPAFLCCIFCQAARCAATTKLTRRRKPERGTSAGCRRSGAAPCCAAVMTLRPPLPRAQSTLRRAETYQPQKPKAASEPKRRATKRLKPADERRSRATRKPKRRARTENFQPPKPRREYSHLTKASISDRSTPDAQLPFGKRSSTTTKLTRRRKPERGTSEGCRRSGAAPCSAVVISLRVPKT